MLFEKQYILTEEVIRETRYRTETRTGTKTVTDPDTGESHTETYTYTVRVPYDYAAFPLQRSPMRMTPNRISP